MIQRHWDDVEVGQVLASASYPLSVMRLVMAAGANRDFNSIHHNSDFARASGAPDIYANTYFLQGMWERCVQDFIGPAGSIHSLTGFSMKAFNTAGQTVVVEGRVERKWMEDGAGRLELAMLSRTESGVSVGPGRVVVSLPSR
jgi:acyl dehydratase